jgi:hypothetical protein
VRRIWVALGWTGVVLAVLTLTLLSPYLFFMVTNRTEADWATAGNIGQAYGFASAALSGLAFSAVAYSLLMQRRESQAARHEAQRPMHMDLLRMAIDDPDLLQAGAPELTSRGAEGARQHLYINLLVQYWRMNFVGTKVSHPESVSGAARSLFKGEAGRRYWQYVKSEAIGRWALDGPRDELFVELIDKAYQEAIQKPAHTSRAAVPQLDRSLRARRIPRGVVIGLIVALVVANRRQISWRS